VLSVEEAKTFLKFALPTMYGTLFAVAITTGMRPSECIGLKWQDVDWERATVSVKRTLRKGPTRRWEYGETKRAGRRSLIRLQNWVIARLKQLRELQATHSVVDPEQWAEAVDLIFVTEFGRPVNVNSLIYKHFKPILKRAGLPNIRLYDLRHTAATLALTVGVSPKVVSEQLGAHKCGVHSRRIFTRPTTHAGRCCCENRGCFSGKLLTSWSGEASTHRFRKSWTRYHSVLPWLPVCPTASSGRLLVESE
jgi:integrase